MTTGYNYKTSYIEKPAHSFPLDDMLNKYSVEIEHASRVAESCILLFDKLVPVHNLDPELCTAMRIAALVHDIGYSTNASGHHKEGRDILLENSPDELPFPLCMMLPWTTFLHRKNIDRSKLEKLKQQIAFMRMPLKMQHDTLVLAAILRIADGLDYSRMDSSIHDIDIKEDSIIITVQGPCAHDDASRAYKKSDLWHILFRTELMIDTL